MIICKTWYKLNSTPMYNTKYRYKGVFLFGFIPLYINRSIVPKGEI